MVAEPLSIRIVVTRPIGPEGKCRLVIEIAVHPNSLQQAQDLDDALLHNSSQMRGHGSVATVLGRCSPGKAMSSPYCQRGLHDMTWCSIAAALMGDGQRVLTHAFAGNSRDVASSCPTLGMGPTKRPATCSPAVSYPFVPSPMHLSPHFAASVFV